MAGSSRLVERNGKLVGASERSLWGQRAGAKSGVERVEGMRVGPRGQERGKFAGRKCDAATLGDVREPRFEIF